MVETGHRENKETYHIPGHISYMTRRLRLLLKGIDSDYKSDVQIARLRGTDRDPIDSSSFTHSSDGLSPQSFEPILAALISSTTHRTRTIEQVNSLSNQESNELKKTCTGAHTIIIGSGFAGTSLALELRASSPSSSILIADRNLRRGGQFRNGFPFRLNTRTYGDILNFPGVYDEPNKLSKNSLLDPSAITTEQFPTSQDMADVIALNSFLSTRAMLGVNLVKITKPDKDDKTGWMYELTFQDQESGKFITLGANNIALTIGLGKPKIPEMDDLSNQVVRENKEHVFTQESFRNFLEIASVDELRNVLKNKIGIIGSGDSAKVMIESIVAKLRQNGYSEQEINEQFNGCIIWLTGSKNYSSSESYLSNPDVNIRYSQIAEFLPDENKEQSLVSPIHKRLISIRSEKLLDETFKFISICKSKDDIQEHQLTMGNIIFTAGYESEDIGSLLGGFETKNFELISESNLPIGLKLSNESIFVCGAAAKIPNDSEEIKDRRDSMQRLAPRIALVAQLIARTPTPVFTRG